VMKFWLDMGIDGFRVDAVPYLIEREGTINENLPETHEYLKRMRAFVDAYYPNTVLLAEANQWARDLIPYFGNNDEFHMCFHFPMMPRLYMALAKQDRSSVVDTLADTPPIHPENQWATFLRNHDELTLEMVTEEERQFMWNHYSPDPKQRINLGIRRRLASLMNNDRRRIELMYSMLFTLPGTPVLYYGDEIGMGDNIALFDRNGVRTPMQWDARKNGGFSDAATESLYAAPIDNADFGYQKVNVESQMADSDSLLHGVRRKIAIFKQHPAFTLGDLVWLEDAPKQLLCFWRRHEADKVLALHNLSDKEASLALPAGNYRDLLNSDTRFSGTVRLAPYAHHWLVEE
jgi:maltose alpha-D-glucosyltransferase/alpha-amylase